MCRERNTPWALRLVALATLLTPRFVSAQSAPVAAPAVEEGFTLADALRAVTAEHPRLASARSLLRAAGHDVEAAGLWTNPQLGAVYMRSFGFTTFDPAIGVAQLGVTQQIETAGVPTYRRRAAGHERTAARLDLEGARRSVELRVVSAFVRLVVAWSRRAVLQGSLAQTERLVTLVNARVEAGAAPGYERTRAALSLADARAALGDAEAEGSLARGAFDVAVGPAASALRGQPRADLDAGPALPPLTHALDELPSTRADLGAGRARVQAARSRVDVARREVAPGIQVYGGLLVGQGYGEQGQRQVDFMVGVTVPLPVVNGGHEAAQAAEARAMAAREDADANLIEARQRVESAWREVQQRRETLAAFRTHDAEQERLLNESSAAYRDGRIAVQALIDAYDTVRDARLRALDLAGAAREAEARLWEAVGLFPAGPSR